MRILNRTVKGAAIDSAVFLVQREYYRTGGARKGEKGGGSWALGPRRNHPVLYRGSEDFTDVGLSKTKWSSFLL